MRRAIAMSAALLLLVGCTSTPSNGGAQQGESDSSHGTSSVIQSTTDDHSDPSDGVEQGDQSVDGDAEPVNEPAPTIEPPGTLPLSWEEATVVDTGWSVLPQLRDSFFVGYTAPDSDEGELTFSVIDTYGTVLWRAKRPATCTGFAVSTADDTPIVVLTDSEVVGSANSQGSTNSATGDSGAQWQTTASAYDLASGQRRWGPIPVPGTVQGPGLVFGASAPAATMGKIGPRVALDPTTGDEVVNEKLSTAERVIGEYDGTVVVDSDGTLAGVAADSGDVLWVSDAEVGNDVVAPPEIEAPPGAVIVADGPGQAATMVDLADGSVIAEKVEAAGYESLSHTWVWVSGSTVSASSARHDSWQQDLDGAPSIVAIGTGLVYLHYGQTVEVLNSVTGRVAQAYGPATSGDYALPRAITADGAAIFEVDGTITMATIERPPS